MDQRKLAHSLSAKYGTRDPFRIAQEMGFLVVSAPLVDMRGFQQRTQRRRFIYINARLDEQQQRLVCAHELGHHLLHRGLNRVFMDHCTHEVPGKYEREAHQFSVDLLYDDEELQPYLTRPITDAANYMGVQIALAEYRMGTVEPALWAQGE